SSQAPPTGTSPGTTASPQSSTASSGAAPPCPLSIVRDSLNRLRDAARIAAQGASNAGKARLTQLAGALDKAGQAAEAARQAIAAGAKAQAV
ncbi:unnamed protein product, partial [Allacma fusca]